MSPIRTSTPWPFRPRPEPDEGLLGYLLRIAREYRWNSVSGLCGDLLGRSGPILPRSEPLIRDISGVLATIMALDEQRLLAQWQRLRARHHCFDSGRIITEVEIPGPRVCPECVVEDAYLPFAWQVGHVLHCERHGRRLLETCPACESELRWHADLLDGCPSCGYAWTAVPPQPDARDEHEHWPQLDREHLDTLYRAVLAVAAPGALETWPRQTLPYVPGRHSAIMARAYAVVFDNAGNAALREEAAGALDELGVLAKPTQRQIDERIASLYIPRGGRWTDTGQSTTTDETIALPRKVRRNCPSGRSTALMVSAATGARLLGVSTATLHDLLDNEVIPEAGRARVLRDRLIHVGVLAERLDAMVAAHASPGVVEDPVGFEVAAKIAVAFGEKPWRILQWCQLNELPFTHTVKTAFTDGLQVARRQLVDLARGAMAMGSDEVFSRAEVRAVLNIPDSTLDALFRRGHLPCQRWSTHGESFERKTVLRFMRQHRIARREALIDGCSVREAWRRILDEGAQPLLEHAGRGHLIGVAQGNREDITPNARATSSPVGHIASMDNGH